jgi:hypothetical protein
VTHLKRLHGVRVALRKFLAGARALGLVRRTAASSGGPRR